VGCLSTEQAADLPASSFLQSTARDAWVQSNQDEAIAGIVAHGWLEQIGKRGAQAWQALSAT
ncbi:MAG TPA: hypothetical protein DIS96_17955, partial [Pusillimonas sp.]|nr:hypothetical protein [Pusillimonas sp.]